MKCISISEIVKAVGGTLLCGDGLFEVASITTDSRVKEADLFIALKGERFDGNDFAAEYLKEGKSVIVSRELEALEGKNIILVKDTNEALLKLSGYYRSKFDIPVIGITGSVGKTSTKEMIWSVLSQQYNTMKTSGNFNNEIGVPLTLFNINEENKCAVVEMGMSNFGEMSRLTSAVKPNIAVITNIGTAHIGNLGSRENILKAKLEITEGMDENALLILNGDDGLLWGLKEKLPFNIKYFGIQNKEADIVAADIVAKGLKCEFTARGTRFTINAPGEHNIYNALAAFLIGESLNMTAEKIADGVFAFENIKMRQNIIELDGLTLIEDCYNASFDSVKASLKVLKSVAKGRTVAVLGDILEQGDFSSEIHQKIGALVKENQIDELVAIGEASKDTCKSAGFGVWFASSEEAALKMDKIIKKGDTVLFKGSRGMHLEAVCDKVKEMRKES